MPMQTPHPQPLQFDPALTAILPFGPGMGFAFDATHRPALLTQSDLVLIERLLPTVVADYNRKVLPAHPYQKIDWDPAKYRRQLVAVVGADGRAKEVWVNCFCNDPRRDDRWKKEVLMVMDGGSCYFNLKINLTTGQAYALRVNGHA